MDASRLARGEPAIPGAFRWRGARYAIAGVTRTSRTYRMDRGEKYVDRQWFEATLESGETVRLYCLRRPRTTARWFLFSIG